MHGCVQCSCLHEFACQLRVDAWAVFSCCALDSKVNTLQMRYQGIDTDEGEICEDMKNQIFAPLARNKEKLEISCKNQPV